jgi:hypothetical protein
MNSWLLPLIVALIGVGGTLLSPYLVYRRDRTRERITWAREDAARSFELRHTSYADFLTKYLARAEEVGELREKTNDSSIEDQLPPSYWKDLVNSIPVLDMFGTREAAQRARECVTALKAYATGGDVPDVFTKHRAFVLAIRKDLAIPDESPQGVTAMLP